MLPDFGIDPTHVIVAVYPPALENETGVFCPQGNAGLTIATLPSFLEAHCGGSAAFGGVLAQYPKSDQVERDVEQARVKLNESLAAFAPKTPAFDVVNSYTSDYASRGVCATTDAQSHPMAGGGMFHCEGFRQSALRPKPRIDASAAGRSWRLRERSIGILAFLPNSV
jgi:hypothetical protein